MWILNNLYMSEVGVVDSWDCALIYILLLSRDMLEFCLVEVYVDAGFEIYSGCTRLGMVFFLLLSVGI